MTTKERNYRNCAKAQGEMADECEAESDRLHAKAQTCAPGAQRRMLISRSDMKLRCARRLRQAQHLWETHADNERSTA